MHTVKTVVARNPLAARIFVVLASLILAFSASRGHFKSFNYLLAGLVVCGSIHVLAYQVRIDGNEVSVRYLPFCTRRTALGDITQIIANLTLTLVTPTAKIKLRGLSLKQMDEVLEILSHAEVVYHHASARVSATTLVRKFLRWTTATALIFVASALGLLALLVSHELRKYWNTVGKYLLDLCYVSFVLLILEGGVTFSFWRYTRHRVGRR